MNTHTNAITVNDSTKLIDGITIDNSIFNKSDIELKTYQYHGVYLENLKLKDLLNKDYQKHLIEYLNEFQSEEDEFKSTLVFQLLFIRIIQLHDINAYSILSSLSNDVMVSYDGIELYSQVLVEFFLEDPSFFVQQGTKCNDTSIIKVIMGSSLNEYLVEKIFFADNIGDITLHGGELLLYPDMVEEFRNPTFKEKLSTFEKVKCVFAPGLPPTSGFSTNQWQNKTVYFINISPIFGKSLTDRLNNLEKNYYEQNIFPSLKEHYIMEKNVGQKLQGIIHDTDGYTNLRKEKNAQSEVLQKIKSGESVEVLDNTGDWWQVRTKEGKTGYVHKSRIKSGNSSNHPTSLLLYGRPYFGSLAQEITVKGEVEYLHNISGWDFVKVNGTTGYLPSEELKQQQAAAQKSKHSFLADEDDIKPEKKKGFWNNLFG